MTMSRKTALLLLAVLALAPAAALAATKDGTRLADTLRGTAGNDVLRGLGSVSYTHLTLPTN